MPDARFGRYEALCQIGDGAMGRVYRAWDPLLSRIVAVKAVKAEYLTQQTAPDYLRRFRREAQAAGALSHPSIVRIYDVGFDYLVMEMVEGPTLRELLASRGRLAPEEALRLLAPVADGIDAAHRAGVVHRDVKPANVMVQPDGTPKLMDFGIAHVDTSVMTSAGEILGSPSYMAPEQIAGCEVTGAADVYALAVVAYEMLAGQPPFTGALTQVIYNVLHEQPIPIRQWNPALPERYDPIFASALDKDRMRRYPTASAFVAALADEAEHALSSLVDETTTAVDSPSPAILGEMGPAGSRPGEHPSAGSGRGWYAHVETLVSLPGRLGRGRSPSRTTALAGLALVGLAAGSSAVLVHSPEPVAHSATNQQDVAAFLAPPTTPAAAAPAPQPSASAAAAPAAAERRATGFSPVPAAAEPPAPRPAPAASRRAVLPGPANVGEAGFTPPRRVSGQTVYPKSGPGVPTGGTVTISLLIDETGRPEQLRVVESAGAALDAAALASVASWRFVPAEKKGRKVRVRWIARQTYSLER